MSSLCDSSSRSRTRVRHCEFMYVCMYVCVGDGIPTRRVFLIPVSIREHPYIKHLETLGHVDMRVGIYMPNDRVAI